MSEIKINNIDNINMIDDLINKTLNCSLNSDIIEAQQIEIETQKLDIKISNGAKAVRKKCIKCINSLHYKHSHFLLFYIFFNLKIYK